MKVKTMYENKNAELRDFLYANTKRGKWEAVVEKYAENPEAQKLKLTRRGDTALHLAVIDNQEEIVEKLVELICRSTYNYKKLLETTNERENNPLHLAAVMGSVRMCNAIASAHEKLVDKRNKVDETPLFLAAVYGNKNAFYCLYYFCRNDASRITSNCRLKNSGDTVLHCAIRNEHFDLAFQLIHMNDGAMHWVTEEGITPLHVLASKPTSFKSGSHIKGWQNIVYYCTFVDKLKPAQPIETVSKVCKESVSKANITTSYFPDNYETCIDFFTRLWDGFLKVSTLNQLVNKKKNDEAKKDTDFDKDVNVESENFDTDESQERLDTGLLKARRLANEAWITNFPENYITCIDFLKFVFSAILIVLGFGSAEIRKIRKKKEKHAWSVQVMEKLLESAPFDGRIPMDSKFPTDAEVITLPYNFVGDEVQFSDNFQNKPKEAENPKDVQATETEMLLAAKNGVIEIVKGMFERFPLVIYDARKDKKNVVLLAAEYRQPYVYKFLLKNKLLIKSLFRAVDDNGNSALHLAAAASESMLWRISGAALQMQWDVKWYKFIEESMPLHFFAHYNNDGKNASTIFHETHMDLVKESENWLTKTSKSCSVVGTLIVTVAFTSATSIPGGFNPKNGAPFLEKRPAFFIFALFSAIALCLSSTSVTLFLSILTYRFDANAFRSNLPWKLFIGLSALFFSIISMLISFCAGHYFLIDHSLHNGARLLYILTFLPVALILLVSKLPLYIDVFQAIFKIVPSRSADVVHSDPLAAENPSNPFQNGKFDVISITVENLDNFSPSNPLLILTPTTQGSYPVMFFLPGCVQSVYSDFLHRIASHGFVIVAPQFTVMPPTTETESTSQLKTWLASNQEMVEDLSKLPEVKGEETKLSFTLGYGSPSNPFSALIGFDPEPGTKFRIQKSQIQTQAPQSSNISSPIVDSQLLVSKFCGTVKLLVSEESS